jgi:hypothetical protein
MDLRDSRKQVVGSLRHRGAPRASHRGCPLLQSFLVALCVVLLPVAGCGSSGPKLGKVSGTVTLDGKPLPDARIEFQPGPEGSPSEARTDENGHYELMYGPDKPGAIVGEHLVRISTARMELADELGREMISHPELLPPRYNQESELKREVVAGSQTIDFELTSGNGPTP